MTIRVEFGRSRSRRYEAAVRFCRRFPRYSERVADSEVIHAVEIHSSDRQTWAALIVHRLTNDKDREVVERACGEIDRSASSFLPNLQPGEAAIIETDFPIPMTIQTIQIEPPEFGSIKTGREAYALSQVILDIGYALKHRWL
jgi:hypothetical protein